MQFLARPDADDLLGNVGAIAVARSTIAPRGFSARNFPAVHAREILRTKSTPCRNVIQNRVMRSVIGRCRSLGNLFPEERDDGTARSDDISVPHGREPRPVLPARLLAATNSLSDTSLVAPYRLIGLAALSVDRAITFSYFVGDSRLDDVFRPVDVGLDALHGIVLGCRYLLQRRGVNHEVHPASPD